MSERASPSTLGCLSQPQRAILDRLTQFKTSREIGAELGIPPKTVNECIELAQADLGAKSRADLALVYADLREAEWPGYGAEHPKPRRAAKTIHSILRPPPFGGAERNIMCWDFTIFAILQIAFVGLLCVGALMLLVRALYRVLG